jgi:Cdc6-like AAA superfamily ATPase/archaellum component FlaC
MSSDLSLLTAQLKSYLSVESEKRPQALKFIVDYPRFIKTLENIQSLIGLNQAKQQITQQVKSFIVNYRRFNQPTNREMLHTLIYGPPGCGKTELGQLLAELWASSGCLPTDTTDQKLFLVHHGSSSKSKLSTSNDPEKITLKQNLAVRDSQLKQCQERLKTLSNTVGNVLTTLNNVRKKIKPKNDGHDQQIQAKFQEIKETLKIVSGNPFNSATKPSLSSSQVLPVTVPKVPGSRSVFGESQLPKDFVPILPKVGDSNVSIIDSGSVKPDPNKPLAKFVRITRGDLVAKYQGHTTDQVREILTQHVGGVVMIDEAYNLCTSGQDDFGKEILTEIINFMTTHPDKIIFIFAGYRKEMEDSVLKFQPGLSRRFNWTFEINEYSSEELCDIFQKQIKRSYSSSKTGLPDVDITMKDETILKLKSLFEKNKDKFPYYGGDTERLTTFLREVINSQHWERALDDEITKDDYNRLFNEVTFEEIETAFAKYLLNSAKLKEVEKDTKEKEESFNKIRHMYV